MNNLGRYILTFAITLIIGLFFIIFKKYKFEKINLFERILIVLVGYLILPATISIPYYLNLENIGIINCYFEAISGFTSTGFTIFNKRTPQKVPIFNFLGYSLEKIINLPKK